MNEDDFLETDEEGFVYLTRDMMQYKIDILRKQLEQSENFIEMRDKDGNLISKKENSDSETARQKIIEERKRQMKEGGYFKDQNKENEIERDDDEEPKWTEVRGSSSFYFICPICGSMIPGTGPKINCSDGVSRFPKDLHEWWHKTVACDWFQE